MPRNLPPLQVDTVYRAQDFEDFEFEARSIRRAKTGEDTAILHLHLANKTIIEIPATDENMLHLLRIMIEAHPAATLDHLKTRSWCPAALKEA